MPSTSQKQHNLMAAVANNPAFAKKTGIPQSVGKDFTSADKGIKFKGGSSSRPDLQRVNEKDTRHGKMELFKKGGDTMATKGMNPFAKFEKSGKDVEKKGVKEGSKKDMMMDKAQMGMKSGGAAKKMATGGFVRAADGVAQRGKTKAKQVKMNKGGMAC